jgi:hypothetical protein
MPGVKTVFAIFSSDFYERVVEINYKLNCEGVCCGSFDVVVKS